MEVFAQARNTIVGDSRNMSHTLKDLLSTVEAIVAIVGLSVLGLITAFRRAYGWLIARLHRRSDRLKLGDREYAVWQRLAKQSGLDLDGESVVRQIADVATELSASVVSGLRSEITERLAKPASGTIGLTYGDLLEEPDLLIDQKFVDSDGNVLVGGSGRTLVERTSDPLRRGLLLVGDAGTGKSMACRWIEHYSLRQPSPTTWLFTIDVHDAGDTEAGTYAVGSSDWLLGVVERRLFQAPLSPFERKVMSEQLDSSLELIIDGLDEIAARMSTSDAERFLDSWAVRHASVVTARSSFYETSLVGRQTLGPLRAAFACEPDERQLVRYIESLSRRMYPAAEAAAAHAAAALGLRERVDAVRELTRNPLLLAMYVSLRSFDQTASPTASTVYREFVRQSLNRERTEGRTALPLDILIPALCEIAWLDFQSGSSFATRTTLYDAVAALPMVPPSERFAVVKDLEGCLLLTLWDAPALAAEDYRASFYHKSFEEYFVARRVEDWLCGRVADRGSDFFFHIDTPEVTFFLKEAIEGIDDDPALRQEASIRLKNLLIESLEARTSASDEGAARLSNFAAGQVAYYLGMLGDRSVQRWLEDLVETESVFWIKRSAVIGLAFGGAPAAFHRFIDEMRSGIEQGDMSLARMNIAIELAFYGDQPFDSLDPTYDAGGDSCRRLVGRSFLELGMDVEAANWRMILFNLNYLARHRAGSSRCFREEISSRRDELLAELQVMASDPTRSRFPEITELFAVVSEIDEQSD